MKHYRDRKLKRFYRIRARLREKLIADSLVLSIYCYLISVVEVYFFNDALKFICISSKPVASRVKVAYSISASNKMKSPREKL